MGTHTIMLIRHAEKPSKDGAIRGVTINGSEDPNELSVRGWQRAGALVRFFAWGAEGAPHAPRPDYLFAPGTTPELRSVRGRSTLAPLAGYLALPISTAFHKGEEDLLAGAANRLSGTVLIAWEHHALADLAKALVGSALATPPEWPDHRFDMLWLFERESDGAAEAAWRFSQIPMLLLAGDSRDPI